VFIVFSIVQGASTRSRNSPLILCALRRLDATALCICITLFSLFLPLPLVDVSSG